MGKCQSALAYRIFKQMEKKKNKQEGTAMVKKKTYSVETTLTFSTLIDAKTKEEAMELAIGSFADEYNIDVDESECKVSELQL